ncbi:Uncharacterised protein [Streptococcus pneumoniae]|nr:Uncharacterised protein [Streptococcus pneumoniae]
MQGIQLIERGNDTGKGNFTATSAGSTRLISIALDVAILKTSLFDIP